MHASQTSRRLLTFKSDQAATLINEVLTPTKHLVVVPDVLAQLLTACKVFGRLQDMEKFTPNARQRRIIEDGLEEHRKAQSTGRPAPKRLMRKWNSEAGISSPDTPRSWAVHAQKERAKQVNGMSFVTFFRHVSNLFGKRTGDARQGYSPEEIAEAAGSGELDQILAEQGIQLDEDDGRHIPRRKFSELRGFERESFDAEKYEKDLGRKR
jgi:hypothetical protein